MRHNLDERQIMLLMGVRDNKSIPEMAAQIRKSQRTVNVDLGTLVEMGLVWKEVNERGKTRMRGYRLTSQGEEALRERRISTEKAFS